MKRLLCRLNIKLVMYTEQYDREIEFVTYDANSFIADVGGFLGLLLGSSMLAIYDHGVQAARTLFAYDAPIIIIREHFN